MVKLLRLTTEKQDASFDIQFNEDIIIKPKSQMALKNVTFTMDEDVLTIDNTNSKFLFSTDFDPSSNDNSREFALRFGKFNLYHSNDTNEELRNFQMFIELLNENANSKLKCINANNDFNTEVIFSVNENNLFQMECFKSILFDFVPTLADITSDIDIDKSNAGRIEVAQLDDDESTITQKHKLVFNDEFIKGAGVFRCKIADFTDNGSGNRDNGFEIGLSDVSPSTFINNTNMKNSERTFMIRFNRVGEVYTFLETREDGDTSPETNSSITATKGATATLSTNDIIELKLEQGEIVGNVYMHDGSNYVKHQIFRNTLYGDLSEDAQRVNGLATFYDLHPYIVMYGDRNDVAICDIQHSLRESKMINYQQRKILDPSLPKITYLAGANPIKTDNTYAKQGFLSFQSLEISRYLGFNSKEVLSNPAEYSGIGDFPNIIMIAEEVFKPAIYSRNFIIEMQNISLTSYDSLYNGRKSILATVVDGNDISINGQDIISYEPSEITYIDIDNMSERNIRNIKLKILDKNLNQIKIQGLAVVTILIKEP
tara:strand:- start:926 stop:2554 length:1629 start_codon:yes stop_codon:yes gene_type:complete